MFSFAADWVIASDPPEGALMSPERAATVDIVSSTGPADQTGMLSASPQAPEGAGHNGSFSAPSENGTAR